MTDECLTTRDLASRWKMKPGTLRTWRARGTGPRYFRPNGERGSVRYKLAEIVEWEKVHRSGGGMA